MRRIILPLSALALALAAPVPAGASGDIGCTPSMRLAHANLSGCDDMAMLGPGNDTRTNLIWLLLDRRGALPVPGKGPDPDHPLPALFDWRTFAGWLAPGIGDDESLYASGEGSRCRSSESGAVAFAAAVGAARLPNGEDKALVDARNALKPDCAKPVDAAATAGLADHVKSPAGKAFGAYIAASIAFYDGDYDLAHNLYAAIQSSPGPWLRETARYMAARVEVNRMQVNLFDEFGNPKDFKTIDPKVTDAADAALHAYLKDYPSGLYAASARGLLRRVYWFGGRRDLLAREYVAMLTGVADGTQEVRLAEELDTKLFPGLTIGNTTDPTLLAVLDLRRMRMADDDVSAGCCMDTITRPELDGQRAAFARNTALFDYLLAAHSFYVAKKPGEVLTLIPDAAKQPRFTPLQFSRQMLRGMALEAVKDRNARGFWLEMLPGAKLDAQHSAIELAIAWHDERTGGLAKVFAPDSPVDDKVLRETLLTNVADPALLRQQAKGARAGHEREVALFTLLYKELSRGGYAAFLGDLSLVPANAPTDDSIYDVINAEHLPVGLFTQTTGSSDPDCPSIKRIAADLAASPRNWTAQLCLAEFFRTENFDDFVLDRQPPSNDLGGTPTLFAGSVYSRLEVYKKIIADPAAKADDKAYALFRAVNCYAPSGTNTCGGVEVDKSVRKAWFQRLKTGYPKSRWAGELRYYW